MGDTRQPMTYDELASALCARPGWALVHDRLVREHDCGGWEAVQAAVGRIAQAANDLDHHPDWTQRGAVLRIEVRTHRPSGITALDLALVDAVDAILGAPA